MKPRDGISLPAQGLQQSGLGLRRCQRLAPDGTPELADDVASNQITEGDALAARRLLDEAARSWVLLDMAGPVVQRGRAPVPPRAGPHAGRPSSGDRARVPERDLVKSLWSRLMTGFRANASALGFVTSP